MYLLDWERRRLDVFDAGGRRLPEVEDVGAVRDRFDPPAVVLDHEGRFCLPESLTPACDRRAPHPPQSVTAPIAQCLPCAETGWSLTGRGVASPSLLVGSSVPHRS